MKLIQHLKQTNKTHIYGTNIWSLDIYKLVNHVIYFLIETSARLS